MPFHMTQTKHMISYKDSHELAYLSSMWSVLPMRRAKSEFDMLV